MRKTKFFLFLACLLIFFPTAYAQEFEAWPEPLSLCRCSSASQEIFILNNGADSVFFASLSGTEMAGLSETTFFVPAGEKKSFFVNYHAPCTGASESATIEISSISGAKKIIQQNIEPIACPNSEINPEITASSACPCTPLGYSFSIKNSGSFPEKYSFEATKFSDSFVFSPDSASLAPGQEITVKATAKNSCNIHGNYTFFITANAEKSKTKTKIPVSAQIYPCYSYSATAGKIGAERFTSQTEPYKLCKNVKYEIPVLFENSAPFRNSYDISASGASTKYKQITLEKNQRALINLSLTPEKSGSVLLNSESALGSNKKHLRLPYTAENCYDVNIYAPQKIYVNKPAEAAILLENRGTKESNVLMKLSGTKATLQNSALTVKENETARILIDYTGKSGVEKAEFSIKLQDGTIKSKKITIIYGKPFFYTYKYHVLALTAVIAAAAYALYRMPKPVKKDKKTAKKIASVKTKVNLGIASLSGEAKKGDKNTAVIFLSALLAFFILLAIFSLPTRTVSDSLSSEQIGSFPEQKWEANRILRTDFGKYVNATKLSIEPTEKATVRLAGNVAYFSAEGDWTGSNFLDMTITKEDNTTKTEKIFYTIAPEAEETYFQHGINVYKTLGLAAYDYTRAHIIYACIIAAIAALAVFFTKRKKPKKNIKKSDNRMTTVN